MEPSVAGDHAQVPVADGSGNGRRSDAAAGAGRGPAAAGGPADPTELARELDASTSGSAAALARESRATASRRLPLERLGDYRIIREIGRGGMGVVYEAEQESLGRRVALKVLPASALATSSHLARFEREARSAARLHHTNIVPIYGVGRQDELHYYVMQFIEGCGLDLVIEELRRQQRRAEGRADSSGRAELGAGTEGRAAGSGGAHAPTADGPGFSAVDAVRTLLMPGATPPSSGTLRASVAHPGDLTDVVPGEPHPAVEDDPTVAGDDIADAGDAAEGTATVADTGVGLAASSLADRSGHAGSPVADDLTTVTCDESRVLSKSSLADASGCGGSPAADDLTTVTCEEPRFLSGATIDEDEFAALQSDSMQTIAEFESPGDRREDEPAAEGEPRLDETVALSSAASPDSAPPPPALSDNTTVTPAGRLSPPEQPVAAVAGSLPPASVTLPGESEIGQTRDGAALYWRSVARIGVQVGEALAYAHRNGTLHRDIKPANLLLDRHGRAWVTDFGLAKAAGSEDLTHTGDIVGTIRYMAPERFEGEADARSDVYGLGLTLYELLARRPAFDESGRNQLIAQVMKQAPPALVTLNPAIPRDLATIVQKSIERDPAHRYQTARELADDLDRFLDDRPILARRATTTERLVRWTRRNPALAGLTGAVVALLVLLAVGSFWAAMHFRDQVAETRAALQEVQRQQLRAEQNFQQARAAVDEALVQISENQLLRVPGFQPLRRELLSSSLKYYEWFVARRADDPTLREDLAESYFRLGEITADIGETREALAHFRESQRLWTALLEGGGDGSPDRAARLMSLARTHARIGELQHSLGQASDAIASFETARDLWRELQRGKLDRAVVEPQLAETFNAAGRVFADEGNPTEALHCYREALKILEAHATRARDDVPLRSSLARVHSSMGRLEQRIGLDSEALESCEAARAELLELVKLFPQHRLANQLHEELAACHELAGELLTDLRKPADGLAAWRDAVGVREELARDNPAVTRYQEALPGAWTRLAVLHAAGDDRDEAVRHARRAEQYWEARPPADASGLYDQARVQAVLAAAASSESGGALSDEQASSVVRLLAAAVQAGFSDADQLASEAVFAGVRANREFVGLVRRLQGLQQTIHWTDDFEQACARAAAEGKDVFVYFSGEDWCPWCAMLRNGVFNEPAFLDHVPERFVMVQLDSPASGPRPASYETREHLRALWGLDNVVPRVVVCDATGRPYFEVSSRPTTAADWVEFLNRLQAIRTERDEHLARAATLEGLDRARTLHQALQTLERNPTPARQVRFISDGSSITEEDELGEEASVIERPRYYLSGYNDIVREILALDANDEAGLKSRYEAFVRFWWVAGPYPADFQAAYPPEQALDPESPIPAAGEVPERAWTPTLAQPGDPINFLEFFQNTDGASAYALTFVESTQDREAVLLLGSDDLLRVWLNGELVYQYPRRRAASAEQDLVPVNLKAGRNTILARVVNVDRNHLLYCRVSEGPLDLARAWVRRGKLDLAAPYYDRAVADDESDWRARVERGGHSLKLGRWEDAEADFAAAIASGDDRRPLGDHIARVAFYAGQRHAGANRDADAVRCYRRALKELNDLLREFPSSSFRAKHSLVAKHLIEALARTDDLGDLDELIASTSDPATTSNDLAWQLATAADAADRRPELAVKYARQATEMSPRDGAFWNTLGAAEYRAGNWQAAIDALQNSMKYRDGGDSHDWAFLAMANWQLGRHDEALTWYRRTLAQFPTLSSDAEMRRFFTEASELLGEKDPLLRGRAWVLLGQPDRALADFTALIEKEPNNAAAHVARGELHARFTRWQQAADDFDAALTLNSGDHWQWYRSAALRLKLGDMEGYIRHCREMLDRFGDSELHYMAERISKLCLLVPEATEATGDAGPRLAAIAGGASEADNLYAYYRLVKGMADYRQGRFDGSSEACADSYQRQISPYAQALAAVFCGMAHHQAGRSDEAQRWLAIADQLLDVRLPQESRGDIGSAWHDWIMPHVAREEARALLGGGTPMAASDADAPAETTAP